MSEWPLTGKRRFRADRRGRLILQVEETRTFTTPMADHYKEGSEFNQWRDARVEDLTTGVSD